MPTRRSFLTGAAAASWPARAAPARRYNVLFIVVDDLKPNLGCYGDLQAISPNIDRLARQGLVFDRAYCQQSVCSPSRTSVLSGLRPDTTHIYDLDTHFRKFLPDAVTLPEHFKNNGHLTSGFSKVYHGGLDDSRSWSVPAWFPGGPSWNSPENAARSELHDLTLRQSGWRRERPRITRQQRGPSWEARPVSDSELTDGKTADAVIAALRASKGKSFFLAAGFLKPHLPFVAPKRYFDLYARIRFAPAPNPNPPAGAPPFALHNSGELRSYADIPAEGPIPEAKALELVRAYYAAMSYTDAQIGRVLAELDRLGLRQDTVVLLWGDHGWHLGDHGLWNKHTNYEQATRAPLIVSVPGQRRPARHTTALVEFVDIYPSLCELCGLSVPAGLEGASFAPLLDDPDRPWKSAAFSQYPRNTPEAGRLMGYSMRTGRYRLTEWLSLEKGNNFRSLELYDYQKDPGETVNLAVRPEQAALVRDLTQRLHAGWRAALPSRRRS